VGKPGDEFAESTVTLPDPAEASERRLYVRLGGLLLAAALGYLVWRIVTPLWQPLVWALLLAGCWRRSTGGSPSASAGGCGSRARSLRC